LPNDDGGAHVPPAKPADLKGGAGKIWVVLMKLLSRVVRESDAPMLAELCRWWHELKRTQGKLAKTEPGAKGYNQLLIGVGICSDKVNKLAGLFGLTPSDRAKLRFEQAEGAKARVATRPKTKLDAQGGP
jgi:phage terminase small subunit